jgi:hypothetical protein
MGAAQATDERLRRELYDAHAGVLLGYVRRLVGEGLARATIALLRRRAPARRSRRGTGGHRQALPDSGDERVGRTREVGIWTVDARDRSTYVEAVDLPPATIDRIELVDDRTGRPVIDVRMRGSERPT